MAKRRAENSVYAAILKQHRDTVIRLLARGDRLDHESTGLLQGGVHVGFVSGDFLELCGNTGAFEANVRDVFSNGLDIQKLRALYEASSLPPQIKVNVVRYDELKAVHLQDVAALYTAFFSGRGVQEGTDGKLARVRYLTGAHGLRPIRFRLVVYGMDVDLFRFVYVLKRAERHA